MHITFKCITSTRLKLVTVFFQSFLFRFAILVSFPLSKKEEKILSISRIYRKVFMLMISYLMYRERNCKRCDYFESSNDHSKRVFYKFSCSFLYVNNGIEKKRRRRESPATLDCTYTKTNNQHGLKKLVG